MKKEDDRKVWMRVIGKVAKKVVRKDSEKERIRNVWKISEALWNR